MLIHSVSGGRCAVALYHQWEQQSTTDRILLRSFKSLNLLMSFFK